MLNPDGSPHNCKTTEELNIGDKIQVLVKGSELLEEYIFLGIVQFSNFTPKFFKLKKGDRKIYIQIAEIQKLYY
jgi:hypothetical protein